MVNDHSCDLLFIDFEASGLNKNSWPIELGMGWRNESGAWTIESRLIRPHDTWSMDFWEPEAEAVHGISRAELDDAPTAAEVAQWYLEMATDRTVISDFPDYDGRWADLLLAPEKRPNPYFPAGPYISHFFHNAAQSTFSDDAFMALMLGEGEFAKPRPKVHRAAGDVRILTDLWDTLQRFDQQRHAHDPQP